MAVSKPVVASFFALAMLGIAALLDGIGPPGGGAYAARADRLDIAQRGADCLAGSLLGACANADLPDRRAKRASVIQVFERPGETVLVRIDLDD